MDKIFKEAIKTAYTNLQGKIFKSLLNTYEVVSVERHTYKREGVLQSVCIVYTLRVPLSVGGYILVNFLDGDDDCGFDETLVYEPIKGCSFCVITIDYDGTIDKLWKD